MAEPTSEWYVAMGDALKARDHAQAMIKRWQHRLDNAESAIQELSTTGTVPEQQERADATEPTAEQPVV